MDEIKKRFSSVSMGAITTSEAAAILVLASVLLEVNQTLKELVKNQNDQNKPKTDNDLRKF